MNKKRGEQPKLQPPEEYVLYKRADLTLIEIFEIPLQVETKLPLHGPEAQIHFKH